MLKSSFVGFLAECFAFVVVIVQSPSHIRPSHIFATPLTAAHQDSLSFTVSWSLLKLMSIESSNHLILCCPLLLLPSKYPSIRVFSNESALPIRWPKYWDFSYSISPSNEYSALIYSRTDWFDLPLSKELSRVFSSTIVWKHQFSGTLPSFWSNSHIRTWLLKRP